jgi:eukaryotic-like serine/threonine-protein kinase
VLGSPPILAESEAYYARFLREAKVAAGIDHPNVVTIYAYGVADGRPYIAMERQNGEELAEILRANGGIDPQRALPLISDVLDALGHAHQAGIVHKDLKPSNLFLCYPGDRRETLRILDFGVAGLQDGERLTASGKIFGTPQYLSPEYLRNQLVTPALDVYQMGLILVETLTGQMVVDVGDPYGCVTKHMLGELAVPASLLGGPLGAVIVRALAHDEKARFPDAHAFRDALDGVDARAVRRVQSGEPRRHICDVSAGLDFVAVPAGPGSSQTVVSRDSGPLQRHPDAVEIGEAPRSTTTSVTPADGLWDRDSQEPEPAQSTRSGSLMVGAAMAVVATVVVALLVLGLSAWAVIVAMEPAVADGTPEMATPAPQPTVLGAQPPAGEQEATDAGLAPTGPTAVDSRPSADALGAEVPVAPEPDALGAPDATALESAKILDPAPEIVSPAKPKSVRSTKDAAKAGRKRPASGKKSNKSVASKPAPKPKVKTYKPKYIE